MRPGLAPVGACHSFSSPFRNVVRACLYGEITLTELSMYLMVY